MTIGHQKVVSCSDRIGIFTLTRPSLLGSLLSVTSPITGWKMRADSTSPVWIWAVNTLARSYSGRMARSYYGRRSAELPPAGSGRLGRRARVERKYAQHRGERVCHKRGAGHRLLGPRRVGGHQTDRDAVAVPGRRDRQREALPDVVTGLPVIGRKRAVGGHPHR